MLFCDNELKKNTTMILLKNNSQYVHEKQNLLLKNTKSYYFSDKFPLQQSNEFDLVDILKAIDSFSKTQNNKQQLSKKSPGLNKQVGSSQSKPNSNINLTKQYSRHNDDDIDIDSTEAKFKANTLLKNISRENDLRHSKISNSTTNNSAIGFEGNVSKDQTSQAISQKLLDYSSEATGFIYDLPTKDHHYELQQQVI